MKSEGFPVDVIEPEAALYLTVKFDLTGKGTSNGTKLNSVPEITSYLLNEAGVALVPFYAFGAPQSSTWFRLSVGTTSKADIPEILSNLKKALAELF